MTMNNLSLCYVAISDTKKGLERVNFLERARALAVRTLEVRRDDLGENHPHLATSLNAVASIFRRLV